MDQKDLLTFYYDNYKEEIRIRDSINARVNLPLGIVTLLIGAILFFIKNLPPHAENPIAITFHILVALGIILVIVAAVFVARAHWGYEYRFLPALTKMEHYRLQLHADKRAYPDQALDPDIEFPAFLIASLAEASTSNRNLNERKAARLFRGTTFLLGALLSFALATVPFYFLGGFGRGSSPGDSPATIIGGAPMADEKKDKEYTPPKRPPLENLREGRLEPPERKDTQDTVKKK